MVGMADLTDASAKWLNACNSVINGAKINDTPRNSIPASLLHLALEHHEAIHILISNEPQALYGSAFALLRPQFECFVRGVWLHCCASDKEFNKFITKDGLPKIDDLIKDIETYLPGYDEGLLKKIKENSWKNMCSFTHGGSVQAKSRISATEIGCNFTDEDKKRLISWTCTVTLNVVVAFAQLTGDENMATELFSVYKEIFPKEHTPTSE